MKWSALTKASGDDGNSQFTNTRFKKHNKVFQLLGDIDMLNSMIGMCRSHLFPDYHNSLQGFNRQIMGFMHTKGEYYSGSLESGLDDLDRHLKIAVDHLDAIDPDGPQGWHDYDNPWFIACGQCRQVERVIAEIRYNFHDSFHLAFPQGGKNAEKMLVIYNRMSKVLYCIGIIQSKHENSSNTLNSSLSPSPDGASGESTAC